jgi:hypothetical protein
MCTSSAVDGELIMSVNVSIRATWTFIPHGPVLDARVMPLQWTAARSRITATAGASG